MAGLKLHLVDIAGTYKDSPGGPFAPSVTRPKHRMLGAVLETEKYGNYFIKLTGPERTVAAHEKAFAAMLDSLQWK